MYTKFDQFKLKNQFNSSSDYIVGYESIAGVKKEVKYPVSIIDTTNISTIVGDLADLTTTDKSNVVEAINEVNSNKLSLTSFTVSSPLVYNNSTGHFNINQASINTSGYLSYIDWNIFNNKQEQLSGTGIVLSNSGTISYITNNSSNWNNAYTFTSGFSTNYPDLIAIENLSSNSGYLKKAGSNNWVLDNSTYLTTINLTTTGTSGVSTYTGGVLNIPDYSLQNSGVTPGTYNNVTVDVKGRVTSGSNTIISTMVGANGTDAGTSGLVPQPSATDNMKFLRGDATWAIVSQLPSINQLNSITTAYTLQLTDAQNIIETSSSSAVYITIPNDSTTLFSNGTEINVLQYGTGTVHFTPAAGVTIRSRNDLTTIGHQYAGATLIKRAPYEWYLVGDLA